MAGDAKWRATGAIEYNRVANTQLAFYASYHSNPMNKAIHFVFIPQILWSALIMLGYLNLPGFTWVDVGPGLTFRPSVGMLLAFAFQFYYIFLDEFVGVSISASLRIAIAARICSASNLLQLRDCPVPAAHHLHPARRANCKTQKQLPDCQKTSQLIPRARTSPSWPPST